MKRSPIAFFSGGVMVTAALTCCLVWSAASAEASAKEAIEINRQIDAMIAWVDDYTMLVSADSHVCAVNDEFFNTQDGGCTDLQTELVWGTLLQVNASFSQAEQEVADSTAGGFTDWRLPTRQEIETAFANDAISHFDDTFGGFYWTSTSRGNRWHWVVSFTTGESILAQTSGDFGQDAARAVGVREVDAGGDPGGACNNDGICDPGEDCETCTDCEGKTNGPPSGRYCCGNGVQEGPEGDTVDCDGNY